MDLSWSAPSNGGLQITSYRIFRGTASGDLQHLTTIGNELTYNDKGVLNGQQYFYAVSAVNEMGESGLSSETNAIPLTIPGAPENLQALSGNAYVNLTWAPPASNGGSQVINYKVFRGDGPSTLPILDTLVFVY